MKNIVVFPFKIWVAIACCFTAFCSLQAQHMDLVDSTQTQVLADTGQQYFLPDLSQKDLMWTKGGNKFFTHKLGFVMIFDYSGFSQDSSSEAQVGPQESTGDIRGARVMMRGKLNFKNPWSYLLSLEYKGLDRTEDDPAFGFTDIQFVVPVLKNTDLSIGKIKETFGYEMVGDAANLPHQERLLNPFFRSRNTGMMLKHYMLDNRMTIAGGYYNDFISGPGTSTFTARLTGLPVWNMGGKHFWHSAFSFRYTDAVDGNVRLKGKNQTNVGSNYVDTGNFAADGQINLGVEQLWSLDNASLLVEYMHNWTPTPTGTEQFQGYYVTASYVLSGEQRPYDQKAAYARRIKPDSKAGAWELTGRYGRVDLDGFNIHGGINTIYTAGLNWWANQHWKAGINYSISNLERSSITGITHSYQVRLQWVY